MQWLLVLLVLLASACCGAAQAAAPTMPTTPRTPFQARCEDGMAQTVSILKSTDHGYVVDNTQSYRALTAMRGAVQGGLSPRKVVLGLTKTELRASVSIGGSLLTDRRSGYECIAPHITVSLYYAQVVVYVGREFKPGTCAYKEVLAHEMRHLNTYRNHLPKVESVVRNALARRFEARPLYAPVGQARALLEREIDVGWMPYMKQQMAAVEVQQAAIDSPAEYARLSKVCKGEVQSLIRPARTTRK